MAKDLQGTYWYNVDTHQVERWEDSDSRNRIGPFDDPTAAANALQTIADREKLYEEEDSRWNGDES